MRRGPAGGGGGGRGRGVAVARDSDASLGSSRPSSVGGRPASAAPSALLTDRPAQAAALRSVNAFLASHSAPVTLKPPLPSARDITDALRFILGCHDWPFHDLGEDLPSLLHHLHCPLKLNRSALKAPGTPHAWPHILSVLHWLVQFVLVTEPPTASASPQTDHPNDFLLFVTRSYFHFITGEDDVVEDLDEEYLVKAQHQAANAAAAMKAREREAEDLEAKLQTYRAEPSKKVALEREKGMLVEDVKKFQAVVDTWGGKVAAMEASLQEWEKELESKEKESNRLCKENEELQRRIDTQPVNVRDMDRMKREMQRVERDIADVESGGNALDEKDWELEATISRKLNEIELILEQSNQAVRELKLGTDFQYVLNVKGSSPAEVIAVDYKATLKPALNALAEEMKKISVSKLEESTTLQEQSRKDAKMLADKRNILASLHSKIDEADARMMLLKNEAEEHAAKCSAEAEKMREEFTKKEHQLIMVEKEAEELLMKSKKELHVATKEADEKIQMCANELLTLIDDVSEYKEFMESRISEMKTDLSETADFVASLSANFVSTHSDFSQGDRKRARYPSMNRLYGFT